MHYHFIAIGGAVMHNLALELKALGHKVTGSDDEIFEPALSRLKAANILPEKFGWYPEKMQEKPDAIILGMHARKDNPELLEAHASQMKIYSFPEFIFEHAKHKKRVVIGGSHGKTTSTAMLMHVLQYHQLQFDYLVGSQLDGFERMVRLSDAPLMVIEGDEYLTSALDPVPKFHRYHPHLAMLTGIAWDHINVFPTMENYVLQFEKFLDTLEPGGECFYYAHDSYLQKLSNKFDTAMQAYDAPIFDIAKNGTQIRINDKVYDLQIFGKHNLENAAGVQKLAESLGVTAPEFWEAMQSFKGTARRLELIADTAHYKIFKDFAHAPSKVKASTAAVLTQFPNYPVYALLELHTFSSLNPEFMSHYKGSLDGAENSMVYFDQEVYRLKQMEPVSCEFVENAFGSGVKAFDQIEDLQWELGEALQKNKGPFVLLMMSSGKWSGWEVKEWICNQNL